LFQRTFPVSVQPRLRRRSKTSCISAPIHVAVWTPFVTEVIGDSSCGMPGHRSENIVRDTTPWSLLTALLRPARRMPMIAILNVESLTSSTGVA
jgi:hypothetical protein